MEMTPNVHPDDDLAAIAAGMYEALFAGAGWSRGMTARLRYERWLREQHKAAHPIRRAESTVQSL